jgi:hypothetical protein
MAALWWTGIGVGTVTLVAGAVSLWWWFPKWQMRSITAADPKARADIEDNFRKTVGQALGGIAVLIGASVAYLQFIQQQQAAHDLLISNQVAKGFEQLAGKETAMRLGGIYALEGVMNTSEQYHQPVLDALCAFVRDETNKKNYTAQTPVIEIQAVLEVISRRTPGRGGVNLAGAKLLGANLFVANLRGADLRGANLHAAMLNFASLLGANLSGADLSGANLTSANLRNTYLQNTDLRHAKLDGQEQLNQACGTPGGLPEGLTTVTNVCLIDIERRAAR